MTDQSADLTPAPTEPPVATATPPAPEPDLKPEPPQANPWDDPAAAKAEIERLRKENGAARTNAKQQAADEARSELAQTIGKALGLVVDEQPIDPADLTKSLADSQADATRARVELAVFRNANQVGGDPAALLDSTSFLTSLNGIDPTNSEAVTAAIAAAVEKNPRLGVSVAPRPPAPNPAQGASASGSPTTSDLAAQAAANGDWKQAASLKAAQLQELRKATN